ncbi:MAG: hypothetical protein QG655_3627 [Actinomycetota bacterium]|nr:hypothetical protein [Actinomycetota bacterium]
MSVNVVPPLPAVTPVVDYEPPAFGGPPVPPPPTVLKPRCVASNRPMSSPPAEEARVRAATVAAATFADAALRRVLEVIDRRRPQAQIRPLLATGLADSLPTGAAGDGAARLRRVVAQITDPRGSAAEVAASYSRGARVGAIACRVELLGTPTDPRWQLVALHIG